MKFNKEYIKKVIGEEIKNALGMTKKLKSKKEDNRLEALRRDLIEAFVEYRDATMDVTINTHGTIQKKTLDKELKRLRQDYGLDHLGYVKFFIFALHILQNKVDNELYTFIKTVAIRDERFAGMHDRLEQFGPDEEANSNQVRDPDPGFMRVPKSDNAKYDQLDTRKDRKNLSMS